MFRESFVLGLVNVFSRDSLISITTFVSAAGHVMIREAKEDTILDIPNPVGQEGSTTIPIPKGVQVRDIIFSPHFDIHP